MKVELEQFIQFAIENDKAQNEGDSITVNKTYASLMKIGKSIIENEQGEVELLKFLTHENDNVVHWSAYFLLKHKTRKALSALKRISKKNGMVAFNSAMTIKEFKAKRLQLPW